MLQEVATTGSEDVPLVTRSQQQERLLRSTYTPAAAQAVSRILAFSTPGPRVASQLRALGLKESGAAGSANITGSTEINRCKVAEAVRVLFDKSS